MGRSINLHGVPGSSNGSGTSLPTFARPDGVSARDHALALIKRKKHIEEEIAIYIDVLRTQNADFSTDLIDDEGFPRADIDVAAIRTARSRVVRLRNDLNALNAAMAQALEENLPPSDAGMAVDAPPSPSRDLRPFAVVNSVSLRSPADDAGLQKGDLILRFGGITSATSGAFQAIAALVGRSEDCTIPLVVEREERSQLLALVPKIWDGRGLLGTHILPLER